MTASVVIPTLNAMAHLPVLLPALAAQKPAPPSEVLIVDSGSRDGTIEFVVRSGAGVRLVRIRNFSHGGARNLGVREAQADTVVFLSQDALPRGTGWLARLLEAFDAPDVAAAFSRQVPRPDANPMESHFLRTHFPPTANLRRRRGGQADLLFGRDVFFSNVSSAARRDALLRYPFDEHLIMSEDQQFARDVMAAGHAVAYVPASVVVHSHNYSPVQALRRYFDSAYSLTKIFPGQTLSRSVWMGAAYCRSEAAAILRDNIRFLPRYGSLVVAKALGVFLGHRAESLPLWFLRRVSMHADFWREERRTGPAHANGDGPALEEER
jgi:rhamnosyltransferase